MRKLALIVAAVAALATLVFAGTELVNFPADYKEKGTFYTTVDQSHPTRGHTVRPMYVVGTGAQQAMREGRPLPSGTIIVMEIYRAKLDDQKEPVKDQAGRFVKDDLTGIFVMEKRTGWGADYPEKLRNGEWEYARFLPDGKRHSRTDMTSCFTCHTKVAKDDYVFTATQLKENK